MDAISVPQLTYTDDHDVNALVRDRRRLDVAGLHLISAGLIRVA